MGIVWRHVDSRIDPGDDEHINEEEGTTSNEFWDDKALLKDAKPMKPGGIEESMSSTSA